MAFKTTIEPFKIKMIEPIHLSSVSKRKQYLSDAFYNPFLISSDQVIIDFLTDSGTSAMSSAQWAGIMEGDEAYAGSKSWKKMEKVVKNLTGCAYILPTHQGRAAERILYGYLGGKGKVFFSNTHFDTTRANIEVTGAEAVDMVVEEANDPLLELPFKGNLDVVKLEEKIKEFGPSNVGAVILTVTNNSGGGQPVSMENAKAVRHTCKRYGIIFLIDSCRVAENAWFIHHREEGYGNMSYKKIAKEMLALADGSIMSAKKDGLVNMGGYLALKNKNLAEACNNSLIITEGFSTYGGLSGRDMEAIAQGLKEVFHPDYLNYRIKSTGYLGNKLDKMGVPVMKPIGGHAVYVDARAFYPHIPVEEYPGQALVANLYLTGGIRCVEIGSVMFGKYDDNGKLIPAPMELVRLAIPRRVYTQSHIEYVIEVFEKVLTRRKQAKGFRIIKESKFLRHFTAHFEPL